MIVKQDGRNFEIHFEPSDLARWKRFLDAFKPRMEREFDWWRTAPNSELWTAFVAEFVVRGGTRLIDKLKKDDNQWEEFVRNTSLQAPSKQLREGLKTATRFWPQQARALDKCRRNNKVVRENQVVLLAGFETLHQEGQRSSTVRERCPMLGLKGASNFLINVGAAKDLAAIDSRIVGCLRNHFGFDVRVDKVQSSQALYTALESALREVAASQWTDPGPT